MSYREFFSHVVDVVEAVGAAILVVGGIGAFARYKTHAIPHSRYPDPARPKPRSRVRSPGQPT